MSANPQLVTCPACFSSGVDVGNYNENVACPYCKGAGSVTPIQAQDYRHVRYLVVHLELPIPSSLKPYAGYIQEERKK